MNGCPNCGSVIMEDDAIFCEECGYQLKKDQTPPVPRNNNNVVPSEPKKIRFVRQKR